jgi:iron complex transport system permease protein
MSLINDCMIKQEHGISKKYKYLILFFFLLSLILIFTTPFFGILQLPFDKILDQTSNEYTIFWNVRIPRVLGAFLAGGALSLSGLVCQTLLQNPLATPFTLGIASGAAFGACLFLTFGTFQLQNFTEVQSTIAGAFDGTTLFAFTGALITTFIVLKIYKFSTGYDSRSTLLLTGVAVSFLFSNLILFIQYLADIADVFKMSKWLIGGIHPLTSTELLVLFFVVIAGICWLLMHAKDLDLLMLGDDFAKTHGVDTKKVTAILFTLNALLVGTVISFFGPIGFVGIFEPYLCRIFFGYRHILLIPMSFLSGGSLLLFCDTFGRTVSAPVEIPVGVITGILGGPMFIALLIRAQKN